ncbi:MAG TPA: o-succinylbenzoate synthase [Acidimicrobiales bacterium]|nr:o-succinylbenzoate synthase [Acidimicrobiales bacterium]
MHIEAVELVRFQLPLVTRFRTSFGVQDGRDVLLVRVFADGIEGWGENVAGIEPGYSYEFTAAAHLVLRDHLVPRLLAAKDVTAPEVGEVFSGVNGWPMAKCAVEAAVLDAELHQAGMSLRTYLGGTRTRITAGVSVGLFDTIDATVAAVDGYLADGYRRIKLKIEPGRDIDLVDAVREHVGPGVLLQVDANAAYTLADARHLARLDDYDLLLIEQPLAEHDLRQHAELARRLRTPICLDESITSAAAAADALALGACRIVNVKPGRVGGLLEARRIHDVCAANGVPVWCGGMLETGIGRAANLALAALPGFTLPADLSASDRYFHRDITTPFVLVDGHLAVPDGPGIGVRPDSEVLAALGAATETLQRS